MSSVARSRTRPGLAPHSPRRDQECSARPPNKPVLPTVRAASLLSAARPAAQRPSVRRAGVVPTPTMAANAGGLT